MAKQDERRIALEIMKKVRRLNLPLKLDEITEGRGNCFPLSVLAQCRRPEIFRQLNMQIQNIISTDDPTLLRQAVYNFMSNSKNQRILSYKKQYEEIVAPIDSKTWREYWQVMIKNYEWVDYIFVQSTAWFLEHDIIIVTTTSTEEHPFLTISGNLVDENTPCQGVDLTIGSMSQVHYQSLLPITFQVKTNQIKTGFPEDTIKLKVLSSKPIHPNCDIDSREYQVKVGREGEIVTATTKMKIPTKNLNQLDISSMTEFPDLHPPENKIKSKPNPSSRQVKKRGVDAERKYPVVKESIRSHEVQAPKSNLKQQRPSENLLTKMESPERLKEVENELRELKKIGVCSVIKLVYGIYSLYSLVSTVSSTVLPYMTNE